MEAPPSPPLEAQPAEPYSLPAKLIDVYAAPAEVFESVRTSPVRAANWIVPLLLVGAMAAIYVLIAFSQPGVLQSIREAQDKAFEKKIAAGQMTRDQAEKAQKMMQQIVTPALTKVFAIGGALVTSVFALFMLSFALWLALHAVHKSTVDYMKIVEVCALAGMIDVLQKAVRAVLVVWKGSLLATVSPTLFMDHPDMNHRATVWLTFIDPIDFWWLGVLSLGVSKVASISYVKAAVWTFGLWYAFRFAAAFMTPQ
jgi:hypothetical protein